MAISKVVYGTSTLIDLTEDSVTPETLLQGETAHNAAGNRITGTAKPGVQSFNGRNGSVLPIAGDYSADQVNYDSNKTVKQVIDALATKETSDIAGQQSLLKDTVGWTGKNLLTPYYTGNKVRTYANGTITVTSNDDGTVGVVGTPSVNVGADIKRRVPNNNNTDLYIPVGRYIFSIDKDLAAKYNLIVEITRNSASYMVASSTTDSVEFEITSDMEADYKLSDGSVLISFTLRFTKNVVYNDVVHPMLRKADITDPTYEPYHESVEVMYEEEIHGVNLFNVNALRDMPPSVVLNKTDTGIRISNTVAGTWRFAAFWITNVPKNTECLVSCNVLITRGKGKIVVKDFETQVFIFDVNVEDGEAFTRKFNTGNYKSLYLTVYCARETAEVGDVTYNNLMLRKADIEDSTYRPYNPQAIQNQLNAQGVLGAKNLLKYPYVYTTRTVNGMTFTDLGNGAVRATSSGATTGNSDFHFAYFNKSTLPKGKYYLSDGGASTNSVRIIVNKHNGSTYLSQLVAMDANHHDVEINVDYDGYTDVRVLIWASTGATANNLTFYPMLRLASDPDDTYQPYAMTNRELTEKVFEKRTLTSADDLNNITETGIYEVATAPANSPEGHSYYTLLVEAKTASDIHQIAFVPKSTDGQMYMRVKGGSPVAWKPWFKFTGTEVS